MSRKWEWNFGDYTFFYDTDPDKCRVCDGGYVTVEWHGIGTLCLKHSIDWILDDYTSDTDYASMDDSRPRCRTKDCDNPYTLRGEHGWICEDCLMDAYQKEYLFSDFYREFFANNDGDERQLDDEETACER